jgi:hypothetical protein
MILFYKVCVAFAEGFALETLRQCAGIRASIKRRRDERLQ